MFRLQLTNMAFEFNDLKLFLFLVLFFIIPSTSSKNINCNGKPYYCLNSTHFMICVDLGGKISTTIDDTVLACPPPTECRSSNRFECEFPINDVSTTSQLVAKKFISNDVNDLPPIDIGFTTTLPIEVTTKSSLTEAKIVLPVSEENILSNKPDILENLRQEYTDEKDTIFEMTNTIPLNNVSNNGEKINNTYALSKETTTNTAKLYSTEYIKDWKTLGITTTVPTEVTTKSQLTTDVINTDKKFSTKFIEEKATYFYSSTPGVTTVLPSEVSNKSPLTQTDETEKLEEIRNEFTESKDMVFKSINTTPSKDVSHNVEKNIDVKFPAKASISDAHILYITEPTTKNASSFYSSTLDVTTTFPIEVTTKLPLIETGTDFFVSEKNKFINNTEILEHIRKEYTDSKDMIILVPVNITTQKNGSFNKKRINNTNALSRETFLGITTLPLEVSSKLTVTTETNINTDTTKSTKRNFPIEVTTKSSLTEAKIVLPVSEENIHFTKPEILENLRQEYADENDTIFEMTNTIPSNNVINNGEKINNTYALSKETITNTAKLYSTEYIKDWKTLGITTTVPTEVTTKSQLTTDVINTDKKFSTKFIEEKATNFYSSTPGVTTVLPSEVSNKSPLTQTDETEILEEIRNEFTESKDMVFKSINTTPSKDVSHNVEKNIDVKFPAKASISDAHILYSTEPTTKNASSFYSSTLDVTTTFPIEVTTKLPLIETGTDFLVSENNKFINNTEILEHIRKEYTDSKDMILMPLNTTTPKNLSFNKKRINNTNALLKETTLGITTFPFEVSTQLTVTTETIINTDKAESTKETITSLYPSSLHITTMLPIEINTKSPFTQTKKTEVLKEVRKELTDSTDLVLTSTQITPSTDASHNVEKGISVRSFIEATMPDSDKIYNTEYTNSPIEVTTKLPLIQAGFNFPVLEENTEVSEYIGKKITDSKDIVFESINTIPPKEVNHNVDQIFALKTFVSDKKYTTESVRGTTFFYTTDTPKALDVALLANTFDEVKYKNTEHQSASTTKQLPITNKDSIKKDMVTTSPDPLIDTKHRISLEKLPDYSKAYNMPKVIHSNIEPNSTQNISKINMEHGKTANKSDIFETVSNGINSDLYNFMDSKNITNDEKTELINKTTWKAEENVSTQDEKVMEKYTPLNTLGSIKINTSTIPTYDTTSIKINENDTNMIEQNNFNSNIVSVNVTEKPVKDNISNNLHTTSVTFRNEEIYKKQELSSTNKIMTENKKESNPEFNSVTKTIKLVYVKPILSETNKIHRDEETNVLVTSQYTSNDPLESNTTIVSAIIEKSKNDPISHNTSNISNPGPGTRNITILYNKIYHNDVKGTVKSNNTNVDDYNVTQNMTLTSTAPPIYVLKQVKNVSQNYYSLSEKIFNESIITPVSKVPAEELYTANTTISTVLLKNIKQEKSITKYDTNMIHSKQVSNKNAMNPTVFNESVTKLASLGKEITGNRAAVTETVMFTNIDVQKFTTTTNPATTTQLPVNTADKVTEKLAELKTAVTKQSFLQNLPTLQVTNATASPIFIDQGGFIKPLKLEINEALFGDVFSSNITHVRESISKTMPDEESLTKTGTVVVVKDKASNTFHRNITTTPKELMDKKTITRSIVPVTKVPLLENLLQVSVTEAILNTDDDTFTKTLSTKNNTETLRNTMTLKTIDEEQNKRRINYVTPAPIIDVYAPGNVTQFTTKALSKKLTSDQKSNNKTTRTLLSLGILNETGAKTTVSIPLSKLLTEKNNATDVKPNFTISEKISDKLEFQVKETTSLSKTKHEGKSSTALVTKTPYLKQPLSVNIMDITENTPFFVTMSSQNMPTDLSRVVKTVIPPVEELSTTNTIETTLFISNTKRPFSTIDYTNNERISSLKHIKSQMPKEFGSVNFPSMNYSNINKENNLIADSKTISDLATRPIIMTTESMQSGNFDSTVTSNSNKTPLLIIKDLYLEHTPKSPIYEQDKLVVPTYSSNNVEATNINTNRKFTTPARTSATIKHTTENNIMINKISSTMPITENSVNEFNKKFTTESSQWTNSKITHTDSILKNVSSELVTEPSSVVEIINITNTRNTSQYGNQLNEYTILNTKNMNVNSKDYTHIKMSNGSPIVPKIKIGYHDGETDEEDQPTTKKYDITITYRSITSSLDNLTKSYKKRDIINIDHISNLTTRPNTNVELIEMPKLGKTFIKDETSTPIYKSAIHMLENTTHAINIPEKVNRANLKGDIINNIMQKYVFTTSRPTQTQQTNNKLKTSIPSAKGRTNPTENLNKVVFKCLNHSLGKYADNTDCRKFYICVGTLQPIVGVCPNNTVFSEINRHCTKNLSHCVRKNQFRCLYEGRFVDFTKDNIYFICVKRKIHGFIRYKLQCLKGYHVNKVSVKCERDIDISESASEVSESEANSDQNGSGKREKSEILENVKHLICKKEGNFPYPKDCRKYYVCSKNKNGEYRRKIKTCSTERKYDKDKNKCVVADSSDEC